MLKVHIQDETSKLLEVVVGIADSLGGIPDFEDLYDPKSRLHFIAHDYPLESDMIDEINQLVEVFLKYGVKIHRPAVIKNCNQIFIRDLGLVIEDYFIRSNILPHRQQELQSLRPITKQIDPSKVIIPPKEVHIEGGDVILYKDYIFIGTYSGKDYADLITARTNNEGVAFIKKLFPNKKVKSFNLIKSNTDPYRNALHLDCCFQPIGKNLAIIYKEGFEDKEDVIFLEHLFGERFLFDVDNKEMYQMFCNVFSLDKDVVISEKRFFRLNKWMQSMGICVEEIKYSEVSKQEGLIRCSTLPLVREV